MDISKVKDILDYWFSKGLYTPDYDKWFMKSQDYDQEIKEKFGDLLKEAEKGKGYGWLVSKDSYVAYIILMDQFSRHIYRGTSDSFKNDNGVLIFCELGFELYRDQLNGYEFMFAFMPYMHTESLLYQRKGETQFFNQKNLYGTNPGKTKKLTNPNDTPFMTSIELTNYDKEYEMLKSMEPHLKGHLEVIQGFGRFPKRNVALGRESTSSEIKYMESPEVQKRPY
jgi:uncharacterized protein (DUF924 family)